jgi:hypothetical protein
MRHRGVKATRLVPRTWTCHERERQAQLGQGPRQEHGNTGLVVAAGAMSGKKCGEELSLFMAAILT